MSGPILRALSETGQSYDDPSEDALFELLTDIQAGEEQFVIVERTADSSGQTYAQVIVSPSGSWTLERREGSADAHFTAELPDMRSAHAALTAWAFELPMPKGIAWERVSF